MSYKITNLKSLREAAGLSIPRLASLSNVSDSTIVALEANELPQHRDRPPYKVNRNIADAIASALSTDLATLGAVDVDLSA